MLCVNCGTAEVQAAVAGGAVAPDARNSIPALHLLTYDNGVRAFVDEAEAQHYPGAKMPLFEKNWLGMSCQLQALRWVFVWWVLVVFVS